MLLFIYFRMFSDPTSTQPKSWNLAYTLPGIIVVVVVVDVVVAVIIALGQYSVDAAPM